MQGQFYLRHQWVQTVCTRILLIRGLICFISLAADPSHVLDMCISYVHMSVLCTLFLYVCIFRWVCRAVAVRSASLVGLVYPLRIQTAAPSVFVQDWAKTVRSRAASPEYLWAVILQYSASVYIYAETVRSRGQKLVHINLPHTLILWPHPFHRSPWLTHLVSCHWSVSRTCRVSCLEFTSRMVICCWTPVSWTPHGSLDLCTGDCLRSLKEIWYCSPNCQLIAPEYFHRC